MNVDDSSFESAQRLLRDTSMPIRQTSRALAVLLLSSSKAYAPNGFESRVSAVEKKNLVQSSRSHSHSGITMAVMDRAEAQEEAYWRRWFWDQAEEAINKRFAKASKRDLKRVRDYITFNREAQALPKKLAKNPQYDVIGGFFPGLSVTPFHDATGQPWEALEAAYPAIKNELDGLLRREKEFIDVGKPLGWKTMQIYYRGQLHPDFPVDLAPETMKKLGKLRLAGETAAFQRQSPATGLPRHVDPCSWVLGCHLGIAIPDDGDGTETPYMSVAGQKYHWKDGRVMIFDPSFKHETYNPTTQERIILNIDIFHPELTDLECEAIQLTIDLKKQLFGSTEYEAHESRR